MSKHESNIVSDTRIEENKHNKKINAKTPVSNLPLDFHHAVEKAMAEINDGARGFFLQTNFGTFPIELGKFGHPVTIENWNDCKPTRFVMTNRRMPYTQFPRIDYRHGQDRKLTKLQVVWALAYMMMIDIHDIDVINKEWVDAVCVNYFKHYGTTYITDYEEYAELFINSRNPVGSRINKKLYTEYKDTMSINLKARKSNAEDKIEKCRYSCIHRGDFGYGFYEDLMHLSMAYAEICHASSWVARYKRETHVNLLACDNPLAKIHSYDVIKAVFNEYN